MPLAIVTRPLLGRLFAVKKVAEKTASAEQYEALLDAEFASRWDALRARRDPEQAALFNVDDAGGLRLL